MIVFDVNNCFITARKRVCEGYVFTGVCLSIGGISVRGGRGHRGVFAQGGVSVQRGVSVQGVSVPVRLRAGGTHPTGAFLLVTIFGSFGFSPADSILYVYELWGFCLYIFLLEWPSGGFATA